jgi:serine/threonine protein kinase
MISPHPAADVHAHDDDKPDVGAPGVLEAVGFTGGVSLPRERAEAQGAEPVTSRSAVGRYHIMNEIARGGMGAIIKAHDRDLRRPVAMKVMLHDGKEHRLRFVEEAQITGQLEHPGIVPVHELGVDRRGRLFFTMKLVNGRSLKEIIADLRAHEPQVTEEFTLPRLVRILMAIADAVAFAHHRGVVHRDLKPANIMIGCFGEVLVMDWGLAKLVGPPSSTVTDRLRRKRSETTVMPPKRGDEFSEAVSSQRHNSGHHTMVGSVVGTPSYMAPEQARGDTGTITRKTDVYALGALLYEMLTLVPPLQGRDAQTTVAMVLAGRIVPPEQRNPGRSIPAELSAIAMKALQHEPHHRYQSVEDFRRDLERFLDGRSVSAHADSTWETIVKLVRRNRGASVAGFVATLVVLTVGTVAFVVNVEARHRAESQGTMAKAAQLRAETALESLQHEHAARATAERAAAPALLFQARAAIERARHGQALTHIDLALNFDPDLPEARLLRGQVLIVLRNFPEAVAELERYLTLRTTDKDADELVRLCRRGVREHDSSQLDNELVSVLARQGATELATALAGSLDKRIGIYQAKIAAAWPGVDLRALPDGSLGFNSYQQRERISDLSPLRGIPLNQVSLIECARVVDLSPLKDMPLTHLNLDLCTRVGDLSPLAGKALVELRLRNCRRIVDFSPLRGMPLQSLSLMDCEQFNELALFKGMPLKRLSLRSCRLVTDLAPLVGLPLEELDISNCPITDFMPLTRIPTLRTLAIEKCPAADLSPLAGLALERLRFTADGQLGLDTLRTSKTLTRINDQEPAVFWATLTGK